MNKKRAPAVAAPRPRGRPSGVDGTETRARIIGAAIACFARDGYAKASNKAIAEEAGVTAASLYHYFDSKAVLYGSCLAEANRTLVAAYRCAAAELPETSSMKQLCAGLEKVIELSRQRPGLMSFAAASASEIPRHDELDWLAPEEAYAFPTFFQQLLRRARRRGELGRGIDIDAATKMLIACISGLAALHSSLSGPDEFARVLRSFERMLSGDLMLA
jgi:AcrR family transcriptional regulator